jgi:cytochrome P450
VRSCSRNVRQSLTTLPLQIASTLYMFVLAMVLHPDVQSRAVAEINAVCGGTIPKFEHKPFLPYIEAICREVLRWQPVAPLGVPHMTTKDDVYRGYLIPKGSYNSFVDVH